MLVDTHCHLYVKEFDSDRRQMIARAVQSGVAKFYLPAIDSNSTDDMLALEADFPGQCFAMIGLHPCSVKADYNKELVLIEALLQQRKFAGIGETGLDFYWDKQFVKEQYEALEKQIEYALHYKLPLILHTRDAMQETIDVIKKYTGSGLRGIFHCFGGTVDQANQIIDTGFYLGIGGVLTYKKSGLTEVLKDISLDHIVLETDAPYLTPVPFRGKRNESAYLCYVAEKLAEIKNVPLAEIASITSANAAKIFG